MIANLIWIHVLPVILWSTGKVTSVETPIHVSAHVYETIIQHLADYPPAVSGRDEATKKFEDDFTMKFNDDSEVCEWGLLATELNEPTNDICIIVAVALKDRLDRRTASSSSGISASSNYSNYDCHKIPIANEANEEADSFDREDRQKVLVCPQITINDSAIQEPITLERFLIGDGDEEQNSIFVYSFSDTFEEMSLKFYLSDILRANMVKVSSRGVQGFQRLLNNLEQEIDLNDICNRPITERQNVCKYATMKKFNEDEETEELGHGFNFDATYLDTSGFVPYRCFERYTAVRPPPGGNRLLIGMVERGDNIYCPGQHIKLGDSVVAQDGFFYSISDDLYEKRIHFKQAMSTDYIRGSSIEEKTVIPFPKRT